MKLQRIAITGIGPICSLGIGKDAVLANLKKSKTNLRKETVYLDNQLWDSYFVHKVPGFNINDFGIDKDALNYIRDWKEGEDITDLFYFLAAVKLALDDSKIRGTDKASVGLVLAHENLNLMPLAMKMSGLAYNLYKKAGIEKLTRKQFTEQLYTRCLKTGYDAQTFMALFEVARTFGIHNYSLFTNNACASGLYALEAAAQMILTGRNKAVVVSCSDFTDIYKYLWFRDIGLYAKDGLMKPFCKDSKGFVFGDAAAAVVLEDMAFAKKRKTPIYAEYLGAGFSLEGWKVTVPQIGSQSYQDAIAEAFKRSKLNAKDIDLLCPHGVSSQTTDYYESKAITDFFGKDPKKPLISAFKPYVGHTLGVSALIETILLLLSLKNDTVFPALNYANPDPKFNIKLVTSLTQKKLKTAMKLCCAFAGYNAAAIFKKVD